MYRFTWLLVFAALALAANAQAFRPNYQYSGSDRSLHFMTTQDADVEKPVLEGEGAGPGFGGASGGAYRITIDAGIATNDLSGFVRIDDTPLLGGAVVLGTQADFKDNFNLQSKDSTRIGAKLQLGGFSLEVAHQDMEFRSDHVSGSVTIFGETLDATLPAKALLDMPYYQFKLGFRLNEPDPDNGDWLAFGLGIGVHFFDLSFDVTATTSAAAILDEQESAPAPIPTIGAMLGIYPTTNISIETTAWLLITPEISGIEATVLDLNVVGKYYITRYLSVGARFGLVTFNLKADIDDDGTRFVGDIDITTTQISGVIGFSF